MARERGRVAYWGQQAAALHAGLHPSDNAIRACGDPRADESSWVHAKRPLEPRLFAGQTTARSAAQLWMQRWQRNSYDAPPHRPAVDAGAGVQQQGHGSAADG